ncbi:aromatic ring-hydroxylating dioxygenase subunit alpha [Marinomonas sp. 5E14-1]|uniref:aromatic ring-hydroxylating oxygenase subunit alpha n=1 Tax=Marinomonas sp. 5E14-1 TaxID=3153922 RepID=UPI003266F659
MVESNELRSEDVFLKVKHSIEESQTAFSLPQSFYGDEKIHHADMQSIFLNDWLFIANECELPDPGDYITLIIDTAPILILRDSDNILRAFHNTCRHRGSILCTKEKGNVNKLVCPYHQWTYDLDGTLKNALYMAEDFNKDNFPLNPIPLECLEGLIYICLSDSPPDFTLFRDTVTPYIKPHQPKKTKVVFESVIVEEANWKLVIENNRECYHCAGSHPELLVSLVEMALPEDDRFAEEFALMKEKAAKWEKLGFPYEPADGGQEFRCIRLPFRKDIKSMTLDGELACKKLLGDLVEEDLGSVRMFRAPNNWHHFLSDHILHFRVLPLGPNKTEVRTTWLVHEEALEGWDYDLQRLSEVWLATNEQDKELAENNQKGILSPAYQPGPYSAISEFMVINFTDWYKNKLTNYLENHS